MNKQTKCLIFNETVLDNYNDLSPRVQEALREKPLVPIGTTLVKVNRLFFRLAKDLSPFFYEVPRGKKRFLLCLFFIIFFTNMS